MDNCNAEPSAADQNVVELSFSDWKKLKESENYKKPTKTNTTLDISDPNCLSQFNFNARLLPPPPPPPLPPPPPPPPLPKSAPPPPLPPPPPVLQQTPFIKPLMETPIPPPNMCELSPLIPQLEPFVIARNQRYHNMMPMQPYFTRPQEFQSQRNKGKKPSLSNQQKQEKSPKPKTVNRIVAADSTASPSEKPQNQPQIFVKCPQQTSNKLQGNKAVRTPWVPKPVEPPPMFPSTPEEREEKQRLWREYRRAMKPFKCREFANAKRTIQRLTKKNREELDEKELERLQRAEVTVAEHKTMLSQKAAKRAVKKQDAAETTPTRENNLDAMNTNDSGNYQSNQFNNAALQDGVFPGTSNIGYQQFQYNQFSNYAMSNFDPSGYLNASTDYLDYLNPPSGISSG